ncbi:hypothetical protein PUH89_16835 [Rhodobacter capsulatus]|uniref:hypothetical protein n=1 Tax=Rhodobacter capsulatus TaxID=1061 RepID=UPI001113EB3E|nr:hypothetical protein [Rhodobacter capsulatus]WER08949.1 hypothetical protein PUH89_16835 [Rhodobacter capsulatus]
MQSSRFPIENNRLSLKEYQDNAGTHGEPDTRRALSEGDENENPGALAGATGAKENKAQGFRAQEYPAESPAASAIPLPGTWNRSRFRWLRLINRRKDICPSCKVVAGIVVNEATDNLTGACFLTRAQFAEAAGLSEDAVKRAFRLLEFEGYLLRQPASGRGNRSGFVYLVPDARAAAYVIGPRRPDADQGTGETQKVATGGGQIVALSGQGHSPYTLPGGSGKGGANASYSGPSSGRERGAPVPGKGGRDAPPSYSNQNNTNPRAGAHPPARDPQARGGAPSIAQTETPEKPDLPAATVAHFGSDREMEWNEWLAGNRLPSLSELGVLSSDATGRGFEVPFRRPPTPEHFVETRKALRWAAWAMQRKGTCRVAS